MHFILSFVGLLNITNSPASFKPFYPEEERASLANQLYGHILGMILAFIKCLFTIILFMIRIILSIALAIILVIILYEIYKTGNYKKPRQLILAITGASILIYLLYTCKSDY
jgi:hypothetical protein